MQLDLMAEAALERRMAMLEGRADGVMSNMAANTTRHRKTDCVAISCGTRRSGGDRGGLCLRLCRAPCGAFLAPGQGAA